MKKWGLWVLIGVIAFMIITLLGIIILTRIVFHPAWSWWWFFGFLLVYIVIGAIVGIVFLIIKLREKPTPKIRLDPKTAKEKAQYECKYDEDNPDNFMVETQTIMRVGQQGSPRTPVIVFRGKGTEKNQQRVAIINLDDIKGEITWLLNPTEEQVKDAIRLTAENPESEVTEERTMGMDEFGRPTTKITTKKVSQAEKKADDEKKEADLANTY